MYKGKIGEERDFVIFKDKPMNNHINRDLLTRPFIGNVIDRFDFKTNQITLFTCFTWNSLGLL